MMAESENYQVEVSVFILHFHNGLLAVHIERRLKPNSITLASSKLVADRFEAKFHYAIWFEAGRRPASNQLRAS